MKSDKCPTCGSKVDAKHAKMELAKLQEKNRKLDKLKGPMLDTLATMEKWLAVKKKLDSLTVVDKPETDGIEQAKSRVEHLELVEELQAKVSKLRKPKEPDTKTKLETAKSGRKLIETLRETIADVEKQLEGMEAVKRADNLLGELKDLGFDSISAVESMRKEMKGLNLSEMSSRVVTVQNAIERKAELLKKEKKLRTKLDEMEETLKRAKVIDVLVAAYGNAGLKRYSCADIAKQVEANVNEMSSLIFAEKVQFHFDVTDTKFNVCYSDSRGLFDVRTLNGAGSRSFTLLTLLGLFPLIHASMRSNILIMDEMDANMDSVSRDRLCNALVPALNEVVDHVIVVTPQDDVYPDAMRVEVVKKGQTAQLVYEG
jgi:DNA repair exonuclease SbcCD ATPase subunit